MWIVEQYYNNVNLLCIVEAEDKRLVSAPLSIHCKPALENICNAYNTLRSAPLNTLTQGELQLGKFKAEI